MGYQDDFLFDFDWLIGVILFIGQWELGILVGMEYQGVQLYFGFDVFDDLGFSCYFIGNVGGGVGNDDVDNGSVVLCFFFMDLFNYDILVFFLSYWFFNVGGGFILNDEFVISIINGIDEVEIVMII